MNWPKNEISAALRSANLSMLFGKLLEMTEEGVIPFKLSMHQFDKSASGLAYKNSNENIVSFLFCIYYK